MPSRDGSDVHSPLLLPTHVNERHSPRPLKSHAPRTRRWLQFYGTAIITGIAFHLVLVGLGSTEVVRQRVPASVGDWLPGGPKSSEGKISVIHGKPDCAPPAKAIPPPKTQAQKIAEEEAPWTMDQIRQMVGRTKGYYARDYSLGLGWNNVRYIFEASLLHAQLLNRTLVLPSFIYARACEWDIQVCASFAPMVNRGDAIGWGEWRNLPIEKQMGWRIPIGVMLDMNHLRKAHPVVTVAEYLQLNGMSPSIEWSNGAWHREMYQNDGKISIHEIPNNEYDPKPTVRVEMLPSHPPGNEDNPFSEILLVALGDRTVMDLEEAAKALKDRVVISGDDQLEAFLREHGWEVLHTYRGALGMDYTKSVVEPIKQVAPRSRLRGMFDDYNHINEEVLILAGETHLNRKPGGLRFVHPEQQAHFASTVLHDMRPTGPVRRLAMKLHERMQKIVGGRQWMGAHMRRGDFVDQGWVMEHSIEGHLSRITQRLSNGRKVLQEIYDTKQIQIYEVPNVEPERDIFDRPPPLESDSFYLATDERSRDGLGYIRSNGGVLIEDLLTLEDRQEFGWPIMITDVLAIIEQTVLSHSAYFYAHAMSSVGGGVVNMRASRGADKRTALID